ncbi:MAG: YitT family protein, partial [Acutalibacteraceae bacterium]|nr:YitT family protein [Acutalibacteraceae bacterium]
SVAVIEKVIVLEKPVIPNPYISAIVGAAIIAVASGIMFYCNSSSGGTDVIALIVRKFSNINIGKALLITDILIVIVGGVLSGLTIAVSSVIGLLIKTLGIDLVIFCIKRMNKNA